MRFLLLLAGVLCLALIVTARPQDESADETTTQLSEDASEEGTHEEGDSEEESDSEAGGSKGDEEGEEGGEEDEVSDSHDGADEEEEHSEGDDAGGDDATSEDAEEGEGGDAGESDDSEEGGKESDAGAGGKGGEEKDDRRNTYRQVHDQLKKIMKVGTKDGYLKSFVVARLQERLMNPTIDLIGTIGKYSKIKECFSSLAKDVAALVKGSEKSYEECTKDKTNPSCGSEGTHDLDEGLVDRQQTLSDCIVEKRDAQ
uniref:GE rich salivary gland protein n=1 Tax=Anopheles cracens TaxID=123217 RepID=Q7YT44_9DIPT|nr:GE rich salivary gland protein [Anopheles cracens]